MSLVTRCPACTTAFKVVRDQLRISDGWVRCGRCSQVFDATLDLQEADEDGTPLGPVPPAAPIASEPAQHAPLPAAAAPAERPAEAPRQLLPLSTGMSLPAMSWPSADLLDLGPKPTPLPTAQEEDDESASDAGPASTRAGMHVPWFDEAQFTREPRAPAMPAPVPPPPPPAAPLASIQTSAPIPLEPEHATPEARGPREPVGDAAQPPTPSPVDDAVNAQLQKALRRERIKALRRERAEQKERERTASGAAALATAPRTEPVTPVLEAPTLAVSFANDPAPAPGPVRSRLRRALLVGACLLAAAALGLQIARHERDLLVAQQPELRPALQALCQWTGCELSALRQIGAITIDGASFAREKEGEGYRLVFTLRNGARVPLAMPSIELSLLDTQERAVVRRVLAPAQFGAPAVLGAGAERNASLPLELSGSEASTLPPVAGYKLVAFYP